MQLLFIILEQHLLSFSITVTKTRQATIAGLVPFTYAGFSRVIFQSLDSLSNEGRGKGLC